MSISTWHNTVNGLYAATHDAYMAKTAQQRKKREVRRVMRDVNAFCLRKQTELRDGSYTIGSYRHFRLRDKKKVRDISVLPYDTTGAASTTTAPYIPMPRKRK